MSLRLTKEWTGAAIDLSDVDVNFLVEGKSVEPGATIDVTDYAGSEVSLAEVVTGLPEGCTYTSDLPETYHIPADYTDGQVLEVTVTNDVECDEEPPAENQVFLASEEVGG